MKFLLLLTLLLSTSCSREADYNLEECISDWLEKNTGE